MQIEAIYINDIPMNKVTIDDALSQIAEIRQRLAQTQVFRGYRAETAALSGILALMVAVVQSRLFAEPAQHLSGYLGLWIGVAIFNAAVTAIEMIVRAGRSALPLQAQLNFLFVEQFSPCLVSGGLLTVVIVQCSSEHAWMLPGLWAILFSMGIFACCRLLPRAMQVAAGYYLVAGLCGLAVAKGPYAFSPWAMAATFGIGQLIIALVLYWNLERGHGRHEK